MKSTHLECLIALQQTRSINKAGALMHTTPQNISKMIKQFEDELGFELVIRTPQGITLTPAGLETLSFAKVTLENLDHLKRKYGRTQAAVSLLKCELALLCSAGQNLYFMEDFFVYLQKSHPSLHISIVNSDQSQALELINKNPTHYLGIFPFVDGLPLPQSDTLSYVPLMTDKFALLACSHSPISRFQSVSLKKVLKEETIVIFAYSNNTESFAMSFLRQHCDPKKISYIIRNPHNFYSTIREGVGVGIMTQNSYIHNDDIRKDDLTLIKLSEEYTLTAYLIVHPTAQASPLMQVFTDCLSRFLVAL